MELEFLVVLKHGKETCSFLCGEGLTRGVLAQKAAAAFSLDPLNLEFYVNVPDTSPGQKNIYFVGNDFKQFLTRHGDKFAQPHCMLIEVCGKSEPRKELWTTEKRIGSADEFDNQSSDELSAFQADKESSSRQAKVAEAPLADALVSECRC